MARPPSHATRTFDDVFSRQASLCFRSAKEKQVHGGANNRGALMAYSGLTIPKMELQLTQHRA